MEWRRTADLDASDPNGVGELLQRAQRAIGGPTLSGTRFVSDAREMLRRTREIEASVVGASTTLYVGFQDARKLAAEADVYADLLASGTDVVAFGVGLPERDLGLSWVALADEPLALENQWFLVTLDPEPIAFVGFETSALALRAYGPASRNGTSWEGFVSDDERLVLALVAHLRQVADRNVV